jgi:hypothetical protein
MKSSTGYGLGFCFVIGGLCDGIDYVRVAAVTGVRTGPAAYTLFTLSRYRFLTGLFRAELLKGGSYNAFT